MIIHNSTNNKIEGCGQHDIKHQKQLTSNCKQASYPCASEQGNVIGSLRILYNNYICVQRKIVIERTRDLIYLKFVATDFFPKIISPSAGKNSGDLA